MFCDCLTHLLLVLKGGVLFILFYFPGVVVMVLGHKNALPGAIIFLATMVIAPYPLVTIGASEMFGAVLNAQYGNARLLCADALSFPLSISISAAGHILGPFLVERCCKGDGGLSRAYLVLVSLPGGLVIYI